VDRGSAALWSAVAATISYKNVACIKVLTQKCIFSSGSESNFLGKVLELWYLFGWHKICREWNLLEDGLLA
jgi:hypothetical protein